MVSERCQIMSEGIRKMSDGVRKVSDGETWAMSFSRSARKKTLELPAVAPAQELAPPAQAEEPPHGGQFPPSTPPDRCSSRLEGGDWRREGDGRWPALAGFAWVVAGVYGGEIVVGHLLVLLDHAFGLLLCHDLAERLEVVDGLPQDLASGVLEDVYTAALPSEGVAAECRCDDTTIDCVQSGSSSTLRWWCAWTRWCAGTAALSCRQSNLPALQRKNNPEAGIIIRGVR